MDWIRENWVFVLFAILFIAMHLFGHNMHGGHGGGGRGHEGHGPGKADDGHEGHGADEGKRKGGRGCC